MANQPKKYKKFVASAATATLVASAIVPVASAATPSDIVGNDHEQNIKDLLELGYVSGKADGTFAPNEAVTRGQVVLMLGKWAEAQGIEVPADYATKEYFTDYPSYLTDDNKKYYALVKAAGIFEGYTDGSLKPGQNLSRVQLAVVLNSAYEAVTGKSLVDLAGDTSDVVVNDIDAVYADYQPAVLAMKKLGITAVSNFNPSGTVTRGQFASFLNATIKAEAPAGAEASDIKSLTATGVSELTVEFNGVVDPEGVEFKLTRGTTEYAVSDVDFNENNTAAVLTVDTKFADGTYTLTVNGISEEPVSASVTTTREEVASIEFNSNVLVLTGTETATAKEARITFSAYNQYGEDITDNIPTSRFKDLKISGIDEESISFPAGYKGVISVMVDEDEDDDAEGSISFTYENGDVEIDVDHDVVLSDEIEPGSVEIKGVYSPTDEELSTENLIDGEEFYVIFTVKDQFGAVIDAEYANRQSAASGDTTILEEVQSGLRVDVSNKDIFELVDTDDIEAKNVDGKWYFAIKIDTDEVDEDDIIGGDNTVTFRAKATGEESTTVIKVVDSSEVHKIELASPDELVAGDEEVKVPVFAYDQNGDALLDAADLNDKLREGKIKVDFDEDGVANPSASDSTIFTFVEENGQLYLTFDSVSNTDDEAIEMDLGIEVDKSGEESEITLNIEPNAHPNSLVGLSDEANKYIYEGSTLKLEYDDFIIEDQYGRVYDKHSNNDPAKFWEKYSVRATSQNTDNIEVATQDSSSITLKGKQGTASVEFLLTSEDVERNDIEDKLNITIRTVDSDDFDSYKVYSDGVVYANTSNDTAGIEVYGVLGNGIEVELPDDGVAYVVLASDYLETNGVDAFVSNDPRVASEITTKSGTQEISTGVVVVLNDGTRVSHALTLTDAPLVVKQLEFEDAESLAGNLLTTLDVKLTSSVAANNKLDASEIFAALASQSVFDIEDQYDNDIYNNKDNASDAKNFNKTTGEFYFFDGNTKEKLLLTISDVNESGKDSVIEKNGTNEAAIQLEAASSDQGLTAGDSFTLTITVDGQEQVLKVNIVNP
nr:S-layer homology domain-containing protein [Lysinibacillus timonensis]